jgi:fumarate reductase flavoprotein subunit
VAEQAKQAEARLQALIDRTKPTETIADLRNEMAESMEAGVGIYRDGDSIQKTCTKLAELRSRYSGIAVQDKSKVYNTNLIYALELKSMLECAQTMAEGALARKESRGSHQRLDHTERDDKNYLKHTLAYYEGEGPPRIDYKDVVITKSPPGVRDYSGGAK